MWNTCSAANLTRSKKDKKRALSARVKGHVLNLMVLGRYRKRASHRDIGSVDPVDFPKVNEKEQGGHAFCVIAAYKRWFTQEATKRTEKASTSVASVSSCKGSIELAILGMLRPLEYCEITATVQAVAA